MGGARHRRSRRPRGFAREAAYRAALLVEQSAAGVSAARAPDAHLRHRAFARPDLQVRLGRIAGSHLRTSLAGARRDGRRQNGKTSRRLLNANRWRSIPRSTSFSRFNQVVRRACSVVGRRAFDAKNLKPLRSKRMVSYSLCSRDPVPLQTGIRRVQLGPPLDVVPDERPAPGRSRYSFVLSIYCVRRHD